MNDIKKPLALVTGASRGIGSLIAEKLAEDGFHVLINYHKSHEPAQKLKTKIEEKGGEATLLPFDVADFNTVKVILEKFNDRNNAIFALVNNAGIRNDMLLGMMEEKDFKDVINTNLFGTINVSRCVIVGMMQARKGVIINITSTSGQSGMPGQTNYASSKAGQIGFTKSLALEVGKRNIRVNAVAPGFIETDLTEDLPIEEIKSRIPLKRLGNPIDVANAVSFLISDKASYITGEVLSVNGGIYT